MARSHAAADGRDDKAADRDDTADRREAGQAMAPAVERGLYLVPKVIE